MAKKQKIINAVGKRKRAVAIATLRKGGGEIKINSKPLNLIEPRYARMRIEEGIVLAGDAIKDVDIDVNVKGGGIFGQADAARIAICNALVKFDGKLKDIFMNYDRSLLVSDPRRTEPHKPSRSSAGPRRKKQQSKR
ncbi:MAG: 30S ribosomal protein S9 [Candidatus Aenigmarchaeota archaeon]|nr:30S ribosomal protein S9 [Candidatus Aenigmarchaeota archaeon]